MSAPVCDVCFTSSWQPCEEGTPNAVQDDLTGGWMVCECCRLVEMNRKLQSIIAARNEQERIENPSHFDVEMMWKKKFDVAFGALMEIVSTLENDGGFSRTVQAIKDELTSEYSGFSRYTSLEWHMWAEEKPEREEVDVLVQWEDKTYEVLYDWKSLFISTAWLQTIIKWAYLPDTGWNK
jgi:hypothetical protein